jgi:hypothetical protein
MKLGDVLDRIMLAKGWNQTELGAQIGAPQDMVSRMRKGDDWEEHWQICVKLLPFCLELDLLGARDLLPPDGNGSATNMAIGKTRPIKIGQRKKTAST